jgi:hypothetical protein
MNDPGLEDAIGDYANRVERDSEFEKQLESEDEQTFLNPRFELHAAVDHESVN